MKLKPIFSCSYIAFALLISSCLPTPNSPNTSSSATSDTTVADSAPNFQKWQYRETEDKMTSKKTYFASVDARELLQFDFPYNGGSTASLTIRNKAGNNDVYLSVTKGQMLVNSYEDSYYRIRFDDKPPQQYPFVGPSDSSSDVVFINNTSKFIKNLKNAKKVIVELEFYQEGFRAIEFDVSGLKWRH